MQSMKELPGCEFLGPHTNAHSPAETIKYFGRHYAEQTAAICGGRSIGAIVSFFSYRDSGEMLEIIRRCCRNKRAGDVMDNGRRVPAINQRAAKSLLCVLALARSKPELFTGYRVFIIVPTERILAMVNDLCATSA